VRARETEMRSAGWRANRGKRKVKAAFGAAEQTNELTSRRQVFTSSRSSVSATWSGRRGMTKVGWGGSRAAGEEEGSVDCMNDKALLECAQVDEISGWLKRRNIARSRCMSFKKEGEGGSKSAEMMLENL
jgi:hypothetical protein